MNRAIGKIDPTRTIKVPGYTMMENKEKVIPYLKSEMYLTELMDDVCSKMDNYVKAWYRDPEQLTLLRMMDDDDKNMTPEFGDVEFVHDGDLNQSLPHFVSPPIMF